jgi:hypothetical protein
VVQAPGKTKPGVSAECTPGATVRVGPYRYTNDQWGSKKATFAFEQCLLERRAAAGSERGWTWNWPGLDDTVFAYPSITIGWKPWVGGESTDARFPMRVGDVRRLDLTYDVETEARGAYNLAPEIWLIRSLPASTQANPGLITNELMFWMEYNGEAVPGSSVIDNPMLGGARYELWREPNIGKEANGTGWGLLSFKSPTVRRAGTLELHEVLRHLVAQKLVSPDEYIASIEFGNEVMGGSGTTWIRKLEVRVTD